MAGKPYLLTRIGQYPYGMWVALRVLAIVCCPGAYFVLHRQTRYLDLLLPVYLALPFSIAAAYLESLDWFSFGIREICLYLWGGEVICLRHRVRESACPLYDVLLFAGTATPLVFAYLYWEVWHCDTTWLLGLTPYGLALLRENNMPLPMLCLGLPPVAYWFADKAA
jgi:hypothetical protein